MAGRDRFNFYRSCKVNTCKRKGIEWNLTDDELQDLLDEAGITIDDVGRGTNKYQLSRYGDTGPYEVGNCRFITQLDNLSEMKRRGPVGYSVRIFGKEYESYKQAADILNINKGTVRNRCKSERPKWADWQITTDWRYNHGRKR